MTPPDDLPIDVPSTSSTGQPGGKGPAQPAKPLREIGPESEVRGGPEAPDDALDPRPAKPV